jgi:hypothetical protein
MIAAAPGQERTTAVRGSTTGGSAPRPAAAALPGAGQRTDPPLRVPAQHFLAALAFLIAGAAGLIWVAPDLAAGRFLMPRVVAVAHLFTLGWITTTILGALYQLLPVVLATGIRWRAAAEVSFVLHVGGLAVFTAGLAAGRPALILPGAIAFSAGLALFTVNLWGTLWRVRDRDLTWWALALAGGFLLATIAFGLSLGANLTRHFLGAHRMMALGVHVHVAVGGWVLLVMAAFGRKLLPMFLLSHGMDERPGRAAVVLLASGAGLLALLHHFPGPLVFAVAGLCLLAGAGAFGVQAFLYVRHRKRPVLDPGMGLAAGGVGLLAAAAFLGVVAFAPVILGGRALSPAVATAYGAALVPGGLALFVAGHHFKILPFLVWYHRFGPLAGLRPLPTVADLFSRRAAATTAALLGTGAAALTAAVLLGSTGGVRAAAAVYLAGTTVLALQMILVLRRRPL